LDLFGDNRLLIDPDLVSDSESLSWSTAFWFWKTNVAIDSAVKEGKFGATTKRINGLLECRGERLERAKLRFEFYKTIIKVFDIQEAPIEAGCYN
jgi:predicted chitinase